MKRPVATDLWTKPTDLSHRPACSLYRLKQLGNYIHHHHLLLLLSMKANSHFTVPQRVGGWVDLSGWLHCTCLQTITHPSINRAWRGVTSLIATNVLLLSQTILIVMVVVVLVVIVDMNSQWWRERVERGITCCICCTHWLSTVQYEYSSVRMT